MRQAVELVAGWMRGQGLAGCAVEIVQDGGRTPLILAEIAAHGGGTADTVLMYGHLDKQPPMTGWREGLGPWDPVLDEAGRLYGRGGADDGYAAFAAIAAVKALQALGRAHARIVLLVECSEESGSPDLPHYLAAHAARIGTPSLVVCLDSGCGNYEQLWSTTSLRGMVSAKLRVEVLSEGVHSGLAGGIVPSPFQVVRLLLERLEDAATGDILPAALRVEIPPARVEQAREAAAELGAAIAGDYPFLDGVRPLTGDPLEQLLNTTWRAALAVTGQQGIPDVERAGNVLLPGVILSMALRIPPTLNPAEASAALRKLLETDPPHGARVSVSAGGMPGWDAPALAPWLHEATEEASQAVFGKPARYMGVGGSIPFMHMIGQQFPQAQFLITGVLGPHSNAHGPNEFLHVPYAKRLTAALARILAAHRER
ncbi:MAG: M20/M25/M40 family metallo-hydrolase, partial [Candidatus Lambdaproteobacteria bacterium]|nr:M20/M25/M40 family metallo-hydrolase [Candidatus Lambdaproteobacteria bacterium]